MWVVTADASVSLLIWFYSIDSSKWKINNSLGQILNENDETRLTFTTTQEYPKLIPPNKIQG